MNQLIDRRQPKWWQIALQTVIPLVMIGITGWMVKEVVSSKEMSALTLGKIIAVESKVDSISKDLSEHNESSKSLALLNSKIHHRPQVKHCQGCHI